jgi:hypothetical protein
MIAIAKPNSRTKAAKLKLASANAAAVLALSKTNIQYAKDVLAEYERSGSVEFDVFRARVGAAAMRLDLTEFSDEAPWQIVEVLAANIKSCAGCRQRSCPKGCPNY